MANILGWQDVISAPITLLFIYTLANWKYQKYKQTSLGKYFFLGLHLKMLACIAHFAYHYYIYGGGDTFAYYRVSLNWVAAFHQLPWEALLSLLQSPEQYNFKLLEILPDAFYQSPNERRLTKIIGPVGLLTFGSFISIAFGYLSLMSVGCRSLFLSSSMLTILADRNVPMARNAPEM